MPARTSFLRATCLRMFLCAAVLGSLVGCRNATIERRDGTTITGKITESDAGSITVADETGEEIAVPRDEVSAIAHAGVGEMITGGVMTAVGLGLLIPGAVIFADEQDQATLETCNDLICDDDEDELVLGLGLLIPGAILTVGGVGTLISGGVIYARSVDASEPDTLAVDELRLLPATLSDGRRAYQGMSLRMTW